MTAPLASPEADTAIRLALDAVPETVLILDADRRIVHANAAAASLLGRPVSAMLGKRPGDAFGCVRAAAAACGCGTGDFCSQCAAAVSILAAQSGTASSRECSLTAVRDGREVSYDLSVRSAPLSLGGRHMVLFYVQDIADAKSRKVLQRTFFHDMLNEVTALSLRVDSMLNGVLDLNPEEMGRVRILVWMMSESIQRHRDLQAAEHRELPVIAESLDARELLRELVALHAATRHARGRTLSLEAGEGPLHITTGRDLLSRSLSVLIRNALDASAPGDTVVVSLRSEGERAVFSVRSPAAMPAEVQRQVFTRYFSTKGEGRGTGLYLAKLLIEGSLGGTLRFVSEPDAGTTFLIELGSTPVFPLGRG